MCLSVTKWVHFNQGDEGVKQLFVKVREVLAPGGLFILEPQPWRSYHKAVIKQDMSAAPHHMDQMQFRPEHFPQYLVNELGFMLVQDLQAGASHAGFDRPMYLFQRSL
jgi:7SK snRNA methylphosphate capping enzyme